MKRIVCFPLCFFAVLLTACTIYEDGDSHVKGWRSPSLSASDQFGRQVNIKEATSGPWAVAFFYPRANTSG